MGGANSIIVELKPARGGDKEDMQRYLYGKDSYVAAMKLPGVWKTGINSSLDHRLQVGQNWSTNKQQSNSIITLAQTLTLS